MIKTTVNIEGMMCSHCEAHVNEAIKENFKVKKVTSSHIDKKTEIISEEPLDETAVKKAVADAGYTVTLIETEPYKKKFLFF